MQIVKNVGVAIGLILFLTALSFVFFLAWQADAEPLAEGPVEVFFLNTEDDANCILLKQGEAVILIDTAEEKDAPAISAFLEQMQVDTIHYLVLTHPDKDHIGGAFSIIEQFDVRYVVQPHYGKENTLADSLKQALSAAGVSQLTLTKPKSFTCGDMQMTVYPPLEKHYRKDNNYSLGVLIEHKDVNMAFVGDAEEKRLNELMHIHWPKVDLYQVAHHGRASKSSGLFIAQLQPEHAVITSSSCDQAVQEALEQINAQVYYTADATEHFVSDGTTLVHIEGRS